MTLVFDEFGCRHVVDAKFVRWPSSTHVAVRHRRPLLPPQNLAHPPNVCE